MIREYPNSWEDCKNRSDEIFLYDTCLGPDGLGSKISTTPKKVDSNWKNIEYGIRLEEGYNFESSESFSKIIEHFTKKGVSLEGKLSCSSSPSLGVKKLVDRKYDFTGPREVQKFTYHEKSMESMKSCEENLEVMKENLIFYADGKNVEVDSSGNFKIS